MGCGYIAFMFFDRFLLLAFNCLFYNFNLKEQESKVDKCLLIRLLTGGQDQLFNSQGKAIILIFFITLFSEFKDPASPCIKFFLQS